MASKYTAILQAALDLVAEYGFRGTTMALVIRHSRVSAGTIYHHFASKDEMIQALYRQIKTGFYQALLQGEPQHQPWPRYLEQLWLNAFHYAIEHPRETSFLEQYDHAPDYPREDGAEHELSAPLEPMMQRVRADLAAGVLLDLPFDVLYELTLGVALALARQQIAGRIVLNEMQQRDIARACCRAVSR